MPPHGLTERRGLAWPRLCFIRAEQANRPSLLVWWWTSAFGALGVLALWLVLRHQTPGQSLWLPPCWFHQLTGWFCTGCGVTRAMHALVHGQWHRAWSMNALAMIALPIALAVWIDRGWSLMRATPMKLMLLCDARLWAAAVIIFTLGRNLPWWPFSSWAPGG